MVAGRLMSAPEKASQSPSPIPDKLYFRIGEVSRITGVRPHVLRYWESEFPQIAPKKSGRGQRLYRRKDVETILEVKRLLYEERYTIEGARRKLARRWRQHEGSELMPGVQGELFDSPGAVQDVLQLVRRELASILELLE